MALCCRFRLPRIALAPVAGAAALLAAVLASAAPAIAQRIDILRAAGATAERALREQIGQALRPQLEVRNGYGAAPRSVTLSPEGGRLALVAPDGGLRLFDMIDGALALERSPAGAGFLAVALGTGGRPTLSLMADGRLRLARRWQEAPGRTIGLGVGAPVRAMALGEALAATGHADGTVTLIDATTGTRRDLLPGRGRPITALAVDPRGNLAVAGDAGGGVRILAADGTARDVDPGLGAVTAIGHLSGSLFAIGDSAGRLAFVDAANGELVHSLAGHAAGITGIARLEDRIATADASGQVRLWDGRGRPLGQLRLGTGEAVTALLARRGPDGGRLLALGPERALHFLDPGTRQPLARLVLTRTGWGAVDHRGRFDGTATGFQDLAWRAGALRLPVENLSAQYFEPGLLAKHLTGAPMLTSPQEAITDRLLPPPVVGLTVIGTPDAPGQPLRIEIEAEAGRAAEIGEIRLFHNGKRVPATALGPREVTGRRVRVSAEVPALAGANLLSAVARGWGDIDSLPAEVEVAVAGAAAGRLQVAAVGIDRYAGPALRLNYAAADAKAVADGFERRGRAVFADVETSLLTDLAATRGAISAALDRLGDTAPADAVLLFLAGHARTVGDAWYFLPQELGDLEDLGQIARIGLSGDDLVDAITRIPARRLLLVVDACQSGAVLGAFEGFGQRRALQALSRATGIAVIAATRADQLAPEYSELGHGLLTYTLLEGLGARQAGRLPADTAPADGALTVGELKAYVEGRAPAVAAELDGRLPTQREARGEFSQRVPITPVGLLLGADFTISR